MDVGDGQVLLERVAAATACRPCRDVKAGAGGAGPDAWMQAIHPTVCSRSMHGLVLSWREGRWFDGAHQMWLAVPNWVCLLPPPLLGMSRRPGESEGAGTVLLCCRGWRPCLEQTWHG